MNIDRKRCKGCTYCVDVCPQGIIELSKTTNLTGYHVCTIRDSKRCTGCRFCAIMCPEVAIEIGMIRRGGERAQR